MTPKMKVLVLGGFAASVLGGGIGGAVAATAASASTITLAASSTTPTPGTGSSSAPVMPAHGSAAHENSEATVSGANAAKAQAAAVKAVGGGTGGSVTTDFTKNGYEVTITKSDGTTTEVHLDSSFNVIQGGPGRPNDNDSDDASSSGSSSSSTGGA